MIRVPPWISLPVQILLYRPLACLAPWMDQDRYIARVVRTANACFRKRFEAVPYDQRLLFLPYCLRARDCPTRIDPELGLVCPAGCNGCLVGELKAEAERLGYMGVYVVVSGRLHRREGLLRSRDFIFDKIRRHRPRAVIGALCALDLTRKYLRLRNLSPRGAESGLGGVVPQGILLERPSCRHSEVDRAALEGLIQARADRAAACSRDRCSPKATSTTKEPESISKVTPMKGPS
ncbi:DUF116 domain-containing protein [Dissulfurirhabdus thermomarina]|uniref:DUF116 domain-containing protein n=1 Tax=Dissulfurirhabdus thermomarina TaxID=1765737 RepID=A0A6N9TLH9_DISTH|nr:DUF116 domain-containing protein [Dissulfurirhabdus thermomarina]